MALRNKNVDRWLGKLSNLNVAKTERRGIAPHKPLMLLALLELIEEGEYSDGWVPYDVRLTQRFRDYWSIVIERQRNTPDIPMPFNALGSARDEIWERFMADGAPSIAKQTTRLCRINPELFECLQDPTFRRQARLRMITTYFLSDEQVALCSRLRLPIPDTKAIRIFKQDQKAYRASQKRGRDSAFKSSVVSGYRYTCALTGYHLDTCEHTIVQAAHIHQHSKGGSDDPSNGLALTPDAHWMFDKGIWTAIPKGDDFLIKVAIGAFNETSPHGQLLASHDGKLLYFDENARLRPAVEHLAWHSKHFFKM